MTTEAELFIMHSWFQIYEMYRLKVGFSYVRYRFKQNENDFDFVNSFIDFKRVRHGRRKQNMHI